MQHQDRVQGLLDPRTCEIRLRRLLQEGSRGLAKDLDPGELLVALDAALEEVGHVVLDSSDFHAGVGQSPLEVHVVAPEE